MKISPGRKSVLFLVLVFLASAASAQIGSMVSNWSVPAYSGSASGAKGVKTAGDVTLPVFFVGVNPCRDVDTRQAPGPYGGPALTAGVPRNFSIKTGAPCTGIAAGAVAYSLNITVTNTQGPGFILIYPQGGIQPLVSTVNYVAGQTIANAAIVPAGTGGGITVVAGVSGTDLIVDINGYFAADPINTGEAVTVIGSCGGCGIVFGENTDSSGYGVWGKGAFGGIGVYGTTTAVGGNTKAGVFGTSGDGIGTYGGSTNYNGGWFQSTNLDAVAAFGGRDGAYLQGARHGVAGYSPSLSINASAILGVSDIMSTNSTGWTHAAIRGESFSGNGVIGLTNQGGSCGVIGARYDGTGALVTSGLVGCTHGLDYTGGLSGTGTKNFLEPHPTDATKLIRYTSLEGPEAGTYFRGTATTVDGFAVITVPETFRWVTDPEGLTVQLTPTGRDFALMRVESSDLNTIVVRSSLDSTTFHFMVNGVRRAYKDQDVIIDNYLLKPTGPGDLMPAGLSAIEKARLIQNGTYNQDGTVNLETAERVGWAKVWRERDEQAKASAAKPTTLSPNRP